jgi:capsular polysaccharide biosynthesis protein
MKQRAAEILFKYKVLILLPLVTIVPLTMAAALRPKTPQWQSFGVVWVDQYKPLYQDERLGYTPAANQAQLLNDFLHTRTFARSVVQQTQLAPLLDSPDTEETVINRIWRAVQVFPTSNNFVTIGVTMPEADLAVEVAQAVLADFQDQLRKRSEGQSTIASTVYLEQLTRAEEAVTKSRRDLATYYNAHPELFRGAEGFNTSATSRDPNLARLQSQVTNDESAYNSARQRYEQNLALSKAGIEGQQFAFTVVDEPQQPLRPVPSSKIGLLKLPVIGMVLALMLSSGIAALLVLTNRAVHGAFDIKMTLGVPVLGEIPELRRRPRLWRRASRDAVRLRLATPARPTAAGAN